MLEGGWTPTTKLNNFGRFGVSTGYGLTFDEMQKTDVTEKMLKDTITGCINGVSFLKGAPIISNTGYEAITKGIISNPNIKAGMKGGVRAIGLECLWGAVDELTDNFSSYGKIDSSDSRGNSNEKGIHFVEDCKKMNEKSSISMDYVTGRFKGFEDNSSNDKRNNDKGDCVIF